MTDAAQNVVLIVYASLLLGLVVLAIAMHLLISKQKTRAYKSQLEQANQKLEQETAKIRFEIQEEDLSKVSGEIHDNIGQVLSSIGLNLEAINSTPLSAHDQTILTRSVTRVNRVTDELRHLARRLNGARIEKNGLIESLENELEYIHLSGAINAQLINKLGGSKLSISSPRSLLLFRIAQEAISNVVRHAQATELLIELSIPKEKVFLMTIADNGKGFNPDLQTSGLGLMTMKKRAMILNGNFLIYNNSNGGSTVSIKVNL